MENLSLILSIVATLLGFISMYLSTFKKGKLLLLPVRLYRLIGWSTGDDRLLQITLPLTFVNTGTIFRSIHDMRIRVVVPEQKENLVLEWLEERDQISSINERDEKRTFPTAPTLHSYASQSHVYTFQSRRGQTALVNAMEVTKKEKEENVFTCFIEYRNIGESWKVLSKFKMHYNGYQKIEMDFDKIHG